MNKTKWKEIILYMIAVLVSKGRLAGCYPLIPGFFAVAFMEGGNRTLLLIFTIFGMALFIPVQAMAKYTMALLLTGLFLPFTGPVANLVWLFAGAALQRLFANYGRAVDCICAAALALCAVSLVWPAE